MRAFDCFEKSFSQSASPERKNEIVYFCGLMYGKGLGVKKNIPKALLFLNEYYVQGINKEFDIQVYYELGVICYDSKDYKGAWEYFKQAASQDIDKKVQAWGMEVFGRDVLSW